MKQYDETQDNQINASAPQPQLGPEMPRDDVERVAEGFAAELDSSEPLTPEEDAHRSEQERKALWSALGADLQRRAEDRVNTRRPIETRWLEDLRQYHSRYDPELLSDIKAAKGSEVFVNITSPKTDGFAARMADMILPTDEKNWAIKPTPVPEVHQALSSEAPVVGTDGQPMMTPEGAQVQHRDLASGMNDVLTERCKAMEREMDDQLTECSYNAAQRRAIDQCAQLGTLVLKGPTVLGRTRKVWERMEDATGTAHVMKIIEDKRPAVEFCDVWDFFPDMNSPDPNYGEDVFQRHYKTKRELRALAKQPGFDADAIRTVLKEDRRPMITAMHLQQLRDITGEYQTTQLMSLYELWEYHGPITATELSACGCEIDGDADPLETLDAVVWVCEGVVLKAMLKPSEANEGLGYHVTWVKKDETSPFGMGIPRLMRNSQSVANAAWRMVMDNAGLALAPQLILAMGVVPADGKWNLYPGKIWIAKEGVIDVRAAMNAFDLPIRLKELLLIFETAVKLADEETAMPIIMQGDRTPAVPETAEGMSMLFNAASVVQRRFVRLYDDRITKPILTAVYDWNMEFSDKEDIKGDYCIVPLGSSALLERERYSQAVVQALQLCASPLIEPRVDVHGIIEDAFKVLRLGHRVKDRAKADEEVKRRQDALAKQQQAEAAAKQGVGRDPAMANADLQLRQQELQERAAKREQDGQMHHERMQIDLEKLATSTGLSREKLMTQLGITKLKEDNTNQRFVAELAHANTSGQGI